MHRSLLAAGWLLLVSALGVALSAPPAANSSAGLAARASRRYDACAAGQRLQQRLTRAGIGLTPSQWRRAQLVVLPPAILLLLLVGAGATGAASLALLGVRAAAAGLLWIRRGRLRRARLEAAPSLARALAAELATGATGARAIAAAAAATAHGDPVVGRLLGDAAARVRVGYDGVSALEVALGVRRDGGGRVVAADALSTVAAGFAAQARLGASGADSLQRLGAALADTQATRAAATAATAEARLAALSVPLVALAAAALLLSVEPRALAAALTPAPLLALLSCGVAASAGVAVVCRLART